jgi:hypothetical protein
MCAVISPVRFQIARKYGVPSQFQAVIKACPDVTKSRYPYLIAHCIQNSKKLQKKNHVKIMIFVVRLLDYAIHVCNNIMKMENWKMDFETFPELCAVLDDLEYDLRTRAANKDKAGSLKSSPISPRETSNEGMSTRIKTMKKDVESTKNKLDVCMYEMEQTEKNLGKLSKELAMYQCATYAELVLERAKRKKAEDHARVATGRRHLETSGSSESE